jgi:hypothetical protein
MIKKIVIYSFTFLLVILGLIYYNYQRQQANLRQARQTQFSIEFEKIPETLVVNQPANFSWKVSAPESFSTTATGIYWSYDSSPSALTKLDSPKAVNYQNFTEDYSSGLFKLPDTFDLNLKFSKVGVIYLRAYALIDKDHLWTQERQIVVSDK